MTKDLIGSIQLNRIYQMNCLEGMKLLPDKCVDMILCDLPYGTTQNKWDAIIPLEPLWAQYKRIIKPNGAIVLTASQPFTSQLVSSCPELFKYDITWDKVQVTGFLNAKKRPLRRHEDILVFYKKPTTYNPQFTKGEAYSRGRGKITTNYNGHDRDVGKVETDKRYPTSILTIPQVRVKDGHATQKPVALFEWLIRTFTNEGETVLDNCMGSGTTAVACELLKRKWIGFETEPNYIEIANMRLDSMAEVAATTDSK